MATIRLTWGELGGGEDGVYVYRDTVPIDPDALPAPLADLPAGARVYEDHTAVDGQTYYYRSAAHCDGEVYLGDEVQLTARQSLPRLVYASPLVDAPAATAASTVIPECRAGDILIAFGLRRGSLDVPSGWTSAGSPPPPGPGATAEQYTFCYYRVADGSEGGTPFTISYAGATNDRIVVSVAVIRHHDPISVSVLALQREPTGPSAANPLAVTNGASRALLFCALSWIYATTGGAMTYVRNWSTGAAVGPCELQHGATGQLRYMAFTVAADANETVQISYDTDASNSSDSRSQIWLALTV